MNADSFAGRRAMQFLPPLGAWVLRGLTATLRISEVGDLRNSLSDPSRPPTIYAAWHETALTVAHYRDRPIHALASRSFDGELVSRMLQSLGFPQTARGSSTRAGDLGALELLRYLEKGDHVLMTVDGPKGPRRRAKPGIIKLAQLSGCPVVPVVFAGSPQLRIGSWDRMIIPVPFSRGLYGYGPELRFRRDGFSPAAALARLQAGLDHAMAQTSRQLGVDFSG